MRLLTVSGPPSSGKTSVVLALLSVLSERGVRAGVVKFDCLSSADREIYAGRGIPVQVAIAGNLCPDHFFVSAVDEARAWGERHGFDLLVTESAGLCNRCAPHIKGVCAVCVVDALSGIHTPQKIGPMLRYADIVAITKGDIVSQAEREVFAFRVRQTNPAAAAVMVNGITGQGSYELASLVDGYGADGIPADRRLRFPMPAALCSYCLGETQIGKEHQIGNVKTVDFS